MASVWSELKRRNVVKVAVAYAVVAWLLIEVASTVLPTFNAPEWVLQTITFVIILGFPLALIFAWAFELTPEGIKREKDVERSASITGQTGRKLDFIIIATLALALSYFVADKFYFDNTGESELVSSDAVTIALSAVNEVDAAIDRGNWIDAYLLASNLPDDVPVDTRQRFRSLVSRQLNIRSNPSGATVSWRPYDRPAETSVLLGKTPIEWNAPRDGALLEFEHDGYVSRARMPGLYADEIDAQLRRLDDVEPNALYMPGATLGLGVAIAALNREFPYEIGKYLIDRYEVTNRQFAEFVRAGGYERPQFWEYPFERGGAVLTFEESMREFVDTTGRPGPATWAGGTYTEGKANHPVTGVSWYEAAAYANFVGRELPTVFHWYFAAGLDFSQYILPFSNFDGKGTAPVGSYSGVSPFGAYDMAGNAREWLANSAGNLKHTAGGGWNDPLYAFSAIQPQPPFDRSVTNGFRLITNLQDAATYADASRPIDPVIRDYYSEVPVSDDVFSAYKQQYEYDARELNAVVEAEDEVDAGIRERITFDAGYADEKMVLYLFRPPKSARPLQTVVIFPGSAVLGLTDFESFDLYPIVSILVRSGRAVAFPIYKATFERQDGNGSWQQSESNDYREHVLQWRQDLGRTLDYLETRPDIDRRRFAYFGFSWGGRLGGIMLAVEPRFSAAVLQVAGLKALPTQPVVDPFNFLPRVRVPVLMISGEYDQVFPLETSARPFYDFLGVKEPDKSHFIAPGAHRVPLVDLVRETQAWLDKYLGPVR